MITTTFISRVNNKTIRRRPPFFFPLIICPIPGKPWPCNKEKSLTFPWLCHNNFRKCILSDYEINMHACDPFCTILTLFTQYDMRSAYNKQAFKLIYIKKIKIYVIFLLNCFTNLDLSNSFSPFWRFFVSSCFTEAHSLTCCFMMWASGVVFSAIRTRVVAVFSASLIPPALLWQSTSKAYFVSSFTWRSFSNISNLANFVTAYSSFRIMNWYPVKSLMDQLVNANSPMCKIK